MIPEIEEKVFSIISESGDAKSDVMMSLKEIKKGDYDKAKKLLESASEKIQTASKHHLELLSNAMGSEDSGTNFLVVHSEDHYSNALFAHSLVSELVDIFEIMDPRSDEN
ncbi:PTS lactose/cellobiose transporter subunit IIA [Clostridioides difficile]|nr:PTS lactose/cellobiose transporter subunit IIA [Clostridioides difficile]